jgi:hypothetical protein
MLTQEAFDFVLDFRIAGTGLFDVPPLLIPRFAAGGEKNLFDLVVFFRRHENFRFSIFDFRLNGETMLAGYFALHG